MAGKKRGRPRSKKKLYFGPEVQDAIIRYNTNPDNYSLSPAYPNPFNPSTAITFDLKQREKINLDIYDMNGNQIANLVNNTLHHYKQLTYL